MKRRTNRQSAGFTLIELMIVLVIGAILLGIGVPSFRTLIQNQRISTTVNEFFSAVNLTRAEALQRGMQVTMAPADASGSDWSKGWIIFVDDNDNKRPDSNETVILRHGPVAGGLTVTSNIGSAPFYIGFSATGSIRLAANQKGGTISFILGNQTRLIRINFLGRARVCDPAKDAVNCVVSTNG